MSTKITDPQEKAIAAGRQLQEALVAASEALKTIANTLPALFSQDGNAIASDTNISNVPSSKPTEASTNAPTSNKRKRKEKEAGAPEKPLNAYHLFASKEKKDQIKQALGVDATGSDVIQEINRLWKEMSDVVKKPFNDAAEKLREKYKKELEEYEQGKSGGSEDKQEPAKAAEPAAPARTKSTPAKGGFTAVKASPLVVNPNDSDSGDDSQDEATVAANLGGSQPPSSVSPAKRQRRESAKQADSTSAKKEKKERSKEKEKEKEKDKDKKKRRSKSSKADA